MYVYLNYPSNVATIHKNIKCNSIQAREKPAQRTIEINVNNLSSVLDDFKKELYPLGSTASNNDLWISLDFGNEQFEEAVIKFIVSILQNTRKRQKNKWKTIKIHC